MEDTAPVTSTKQLFIVGEINEELSKEILRDLYTTDWDQITDLEIYVSSYGGNIRDCFAIIDSVEFFKFTYSFNVSSVALGEASSAGFYIFLLGDKRVALPNARMYVHEHLTYADGAQTYADRKKEDVDQEMVYNTYISYTQRRLELTEAKTKKLIGSNSWLTREQMIKWNIITPPKLEETENEQK